MVARAGRARPRSRQRRRRAARREAVAGLGGTGDAPCRGASRFPLCGRACRRQPAVAGRAPVALFMPACLSASASGGGSRTGRPPCAGVAEVGVLFGARACRCSRRRRRTSLRKQALPPEPLPHAMPPLQPLAWPEAADDATRPAVALDAEAPVIPGKTRLVLVDAVRGDVCPIPFA